METISSVAQEFLPVCQAFYEAHQFQIFMVLFGVAAAVLVLHITKKLCIIPRVQRNESK